MEGHIHIYGEVGLEVTETTVQEQIQSERERGKVKNWKIHFSSQGGGVFVGWTIGNIISSLKEPTEAVIEGLCASIATFAALSCDKVTMFESGRFLIHNPTMFTEGEAKDIEGAAEEVERIKNDLIRVYVSKTGMTELQVSELMNKDELLTPEEARKLRFVDEVLEPLKAVAKFDINNKSMSKEKGDNALEKMLASMEQKTSDMYNKLFPKPKNETLELADGGSVFVETEDGELPGKRVFMVDEEGNPTEEPAPNGTHNLIDGRSIVVEDGIVQSVEETSAEDALKEKIKDLETEILSLKDEKKESEDNQDELKATLSEVVQEIQNMKKYVPDNKRPPKALIKPKNKFESSHNQDSNTFGSKFTKGVARHIPQTQNR